MTSKTKRQAVLINIFSDISKSKGDQAMKFNQLIEKSTRNIFLQKLCKNTAERVVPDLFLFFKKASYEIKASGQHLSFNIL